MPTSQFFIKPSSGLLVAIVKILDPKNIFSNEETKQNKKKS